jgi:hypothetical protein
MAWRTPLDGKDPRKAILRQNPGQSQEPETREELSPEVRPQGTLRNSDGEPSSMPTSSYTVWDGNPVLNNANLSLTESLTWEP